MSHLRARFQNQEPWQKNLFVLWFGTFMAGMAFSEVMPFLSLYVDTLGNFTKTQLGLYSGLTFSATYFVTAIASPMWGKLADRKGRKLMLLRASLGMAIVLGAMGLVSNVWELIALRFIQGVFSGYISNANALMATEAPKKVSGRALGTLSTGYVSGNLLGPLLGGALASSFGYRPTFFITGGLLFLVFLLSWLFVKEHYIPTSHGKLKSTKEVFKSLAHPQLLIGLFITTMIIQAGNNSITPIISLYVRELMHHTGNYTFVAGVIAAVPGVATLIAAPRLGAWGDHIGTERVLIMGFILAIACYLPMVFIQNIWQLGALRFLVGISDAAMLPAVQSLLSKNSPLSFTGRVFSYNQSFQAMGNVVGPMLGSVVSGMFDYSGVFISTAILVVLNLALFLNNTREIRHAKS